MLRLHISLLLGLALLAPAAEVSGVYSVTFHLNLTSLLPAGTMIACRARIAPEQGGLNLRNQQLAAFPAGAEGRVVVNGPTADCAADIPFAWTLAGARGGLLLSYEIDAVSRSGAIRSSARQNIRAAFPASGGSASLNLNVPF
jgi:hypothetical protein